MGSFILDFSAYNALLSSSGYPGSCYGTDDPFPTAGDPGMPGHVSYRRPHHHSHHNHHHNHHNNNSSGNHPHHQTSQNRYSGRYTIFDRNSVSRLDAEKALQERRNQHIANFGATWLKPPGVPKTLFQIREEIREQEEQAETERREELAQQLAQAEAEAAMDAEDELGGGVDGAGGEEGHEGHEVGDGNGNNDGTDGAAYLESDVAEQDLDNEIPDADDDFHFGNNSDDDPFASSEEEDDEDEEEEEQEEREQEEPGEQEPGEHGTDGRLRRSLGGRHSVGNGAGAGEGEGEGAGAVTEESLVTPAGASADTHEEDLRARAAERREMRQMRATEDRVRAMLAQPRLSALGGMYSAEDDLDEEDEAQMLQEDDLVREGGGRAGGRRGAAAGGGDDGRRRRSEAARRRSVRTPRHSLVNPRGSAGSDGQRMQGSLDAPGSGHDGHVGHVGHYDHDGRDGHDDLAAMNAEVGNMSFNDGQEEMDMDADMDEGIPDAEMDLSTFDGTYEHTDTEAELSSLGSVAGEEGGHGSNNSFLAASAAASGLGAGMMMTPLGAGGTPMSSMAAPRGAGRRRYRSSVARSERNSMDISGFLSQDGSTLDSSPAMRRL